MSVPPVRRLPERPSLEQLRKQAKEYLDTLRAADPSATLAKAQHALAQEYGFDSWPKLVHHVESLQPHRRMLRPAELKADQPLTWSSGRGTDVWALFQACAGGDLQTVQALIARDRSLARAHYDYRKPLYFAVRENHVDVARFLLEHDTNPMDLWVDDDPIEIARDRGYPAMERMLLNTLETKFNASAKGETVALALRDHDLKKMRALLDAGPELLSKGDRRSNQPIHWATMTRQIEAIDELLRRGADINARRMDGARPIHLTNGDYFYRGGRDVPRFWPVTPARVMEHLQACGAFIDLPTACHTGDIARVRELLRQDPVWRTRSANTRAITSAPARRSRTRPPPAAWTSCSCCSTPAPIRTCRKNSTHPEGRRCTRPSTTGTTTSRSSCSSTGRFRIRRSRVPVTRSGSRGNGVRTNAWSSCCFRTGPGARYWGTFRRCGEVWVGNIAMPLTQSEPRLTTWS